MVEPLMPLLGPPPKGYTWKLTRERGKLLGRSGYTYRLNVYKDGERLEICHGRISDGDDHEGKVKSMEEKMRKKYSK